VLREEMGEAESKRRTASRLAAPAHPVRTGHRPGVLPGRTGAGAPV